MISAQKMVNERTPPCSLESNEINERKSCMLTDLVNVMLDTIGFIEGTARGSLY
jgi:hypothetical protein